MSNSKVKLVEFKVSESAKEDVEKALEELLDDGFMIVSQCMSGGYMNFTLVRKDDSINVIPVDRGGNPANSYHIVNGAVEYLNRGETVSGPGPQLH